MQPGVIVPCENMKNRKGLLCSICNQGLLCPVKTYEKNKMGIIVSYMQKGVIVPYENMKK